MSKHCDQRIKGLSWTLEKSSYQVHVGYYNKGEAMIILSHSKLRESEYTIVNKTILLVKTLVIANLTSFNSWPKKSWNHNHESGIAKVNKSKKRERETSSSLE